MVEGRGWRLPEQHLLPDAVVAFVDGELSDLAYRRAAAHLSQCAQCASEAVAQGQARTAVRSAGIPGMPAALLASLRAIPTDAELPGGPDHLAMTEDGQLVAVQRPDRVSGLGSAAVIGSSVPLGRGSGVLRGRRGVAGAGMVAAGLVLGALAVVGSQTVGASSEQPAVPGVRGGTAGVVAANFAGPVGAGAPTPTSAVTSSRSSTPSTPTTMARHDPRHVG